MLLKSKMTKNKSLRIIRYIKKQKMKFLLSLCSVLIFIVVFEGTGRIFGLGLMLEDIHGEEWVYERYKGPLNNEGFREYINYPINHRKYRIVVLDGGKWGILKAK